jgi:hypothetical protein
MGNSSFVQDSMLGGVWSESSQGRVKDPDYTRALAECFNGLPIEEGCWTRRSGTQVGGHTRAGAAATIEKFAFTASAPYNLELTDSHLRLWAGVNLVSDDSAATSDISTATPAVLTIGTSKSWATGDHVYFAFGDIASRLLVPYLAMRQFKLTRLTGTTYELYDPITGAAINGNNVLYPASGDTITCHHILDIATSYTAARLPDVRAVQTDLQLLLLHAAVSPTAITAVVGTPFATFTKTVPLFLDGPYLDIVSDGSTLTPSAATGSITLTASAITGINGGTGFQTTDIGRLVRFYSKPPAWAVGTTYAANQRVIYNGVTYYSIGGSNTGNLPDSFPALWSANPKLASWTWLKITARSSTTVVTATVMGDPIPYTTASTTWQLGVYSDTTGYPTNGCYHQGRIWLSGAVANRVDACKVNGFSIGSSINFAPTDTYGTVSDSSGISYVFNATESNKILWMQPNAQGIVGGTEGAEWLISAGNGAAVITPTNIQANPVTGYGCANIEPRRTGLSSVFVQKNKRKLLEYLSDALSGRFAGPNLASKAKSLTSSGIAELAYQEELAPVIWMRMGDGTLGASTYRRVSQFSTQPPEFNGWHRHELGSPRVVESISSGPATIAAGNIETLSMITNEVSKGIRYFELLRPLLDEKDPVTSSWYLDCGIVPVIGKTTTVLGESGIRFYGLAPLEGKIVTAFIGGLDCGEYTVADATIFVPYGSAEGELTYAYLSNLTTNSPDNAGYGDMQVSIDASALRIPAVIGFTYTSRGQALRPMSPDDTGARAGPGFAKTKRASSFGVLLKNAIKVQFGTKFSRLRSAQFRTNGQRPYTVTQPFSGIYWNSVEDDYSFDSQFCWEVTRPYPLSVMAFGMFERTEDR